MNITPSVGRRVWYWPSIEEAAYWNKEQAHPCQPFDAGIAHVNEDGTINLGLTNDLGNPLPGKQNVRETSPEKPEPGCWSWMPFQLGQAKQQADVGTTITSPRKPSHDVGFGEA